MSRIDYKVVNYIISVTYISSDRKYILKLVKLDSRTSSSAIEALSRFDRKYSSYTLLTR